MKLAWPWTEPVPHPPSALACVLTAAPDPWGWARISQEHFTQDPRPRFDKWMPAYLGSGVDSATETWDKSLPLSGPQFPHL